MRGNKRRRDPDKGHRVQGKPQDIIHVRLRILMVRAPDADLRFLGEQEDRRDRGSPQGLLGDRHLRLLQRVRPPQGERHQAPAVLGPRPAEVLRHLENPDRGGEGQVEVRAHHRKVRRDPLARAFVAGIIDPAR